MSPCIESARSHLPTCSLAFVCGRAATVPLDVSRQRNATGAEGLCMCGVAALGGPPVLLLSCCSVIAVTLTHFAVFEV